MTIRSINILTGKETEGSYTISEIAAHEAARAQVIADAPYREMERLEALETPRRMAEACCKVSASCCT